jgi:hypothetical protein
LGKKKKKVLKALNLNKIIFLSIPLVFLGVVVFSTLNSISKSPIEKIDLNLKNTESEKIVTPSFSEQTQNRTEENGFNSSKSKYFVETLFSNWDGLFELFAFNPAYIQESKRMDAQKLESLNESINKTKTDFKPGNLGNVEKLADEYGEIIKREANFYKLDWRLVLAMIRQESYFNSDAVSHAGAIGFMQIMPRTGAGIQTDLNLEETKTPENNLIAGIYYYATMVANFEFAGEDKYKFALAAYNAGLGRVIDAMTITAYQGLDYNKWENVKENYKYLAAGNDSIHAAVWPKSQRPPYGILNNWKEPYNYVESITYYYDQYKNMFASNLKEQPKKKSKKKKSK